jgi:molecular chaperone DnaK (HSP70)
MILDSFDHAEEDFARRLLIEARNEADSILSKIAKALTNPAWGQLRGEEIAAIDAARNHLAAVKSSDDLNAILEATIALDRSTHRLAELMMDAAVTSAIRGKTMEVAGEELNNEEVTAPHPMAPAEFK